MDLIQQLEYPLPVLKVLSGKIVAETSRTEHGSLAVDNIGGGLLCGRVTSNSPALKFHVQEFSGNQVALDYTINTDGCRPGDVLQSEAVIVSNGGEKSIPVIIRVIPASITTPEEIRLTSQKDFLAYAKKYPVQARKLFTSSEFMIWLTGMGYEYMDIYDQLVRDTNKERALENFFILGKLKNRAVLSAEPQTVSLAVGPEQKEIVSGEIKVVKTGWGYVEAEVGVVIGDIGSSCDWLDVSPERLTRFTGTGSSAGTGPSGEGMAAVKYYVDPSKLKGKLNKAVVKIGDSIEVPIAVKRKSYIAVSTDRSCYDADDTGVLRVANHYGEDIMIDISTREGFIRFDGRRYFMGANAEIPFTVKLNALQSAQLGIRRRPFIENEITVSARIGAKLVKKSVRVIAGGNVR